MLRSRPSRPDAGASGEEAVIDAKAPADNRRFPAWLPPLLWAGLVLGLSSLPDLKTSVSGLEIRDKLAHFGEYFVFGWLVARAFDGQGWSPRKHLLWTVFFGIFLGAVDEFYQGFIPGREQDGLDLLADSLGALAGWYFSREDETLGDVEGTPGDS